MSDHDDLNRISRLWIRRFPKQSFVLSVPPTAGETEITIELVRHETAESSGDLYSMFVIKSPRYVTVTRSECRDRDRPTGQSNG